MSKALQFPRLAPNAGLTIGAAAMGGLNSALLNYQKMRMQNMQMQSMQMQRQNQGMQMQAMAQWRQAQAQALQQRYAPSNVASVDAALALHKGGVIGDEQKDKLISKAVSNATPADAEAIQQKVAPPVLNYNEARLYQAGLANQNKQDVAGIQVAGRQGVADTAADARLQATQMRVNAPSKSAGAGMTPQDKMEYANLAKQAQKTHDAMLAVDKPPSGFGIPMDDTAKEHLKSGYTQQLNDYGKQMDAIMQRSRGGQPSQPAGSSSQSVPPSQTTAPGVNPAPAKQFSWDNRSQANVGDMVADPSGSGFRMVGAKDSTGLSFKPGVVSAAQAPSGASQTQVRAIPPSAAAPLPQAPNAWPGAGE